MPRETQPDFADDEPGMSVKGEGMAEADEIVPGPEGEGSPKLDPMSLRLAAANALIRRRRTIKPADMSDKPVDNLHLATILENANWAPTHGKTEPWRFFVYSGEARRKLAEFLQSTYDRLVPLQRTEAMQRKPCLAHLAVQPLCLRAQSGMTPLVAPVVHLELAVDLLRSLAC